MNENLTHFKILNSLDVNDKTEKKSNGSVELTYLSWAWAWAEVKKKFPNANYDILKFGEEKLPYIFDEKTGYMVFTRVEIEGIDHEMWLPVMDGANKAMKDKPYTYKTRAWNKSTNSWGTVEKTVQPATMFDINKTIMRCLTKNLAMFGLGLYIYAGEDLPESVETETIEEDKKNNKNNNTETAIMITEQQKNKIKELYTQEEIKEYLKNTVKKTKLSDLTVVEASDLIKDKLEGEEQ